MRTVLWLAATAILLASAGNAPAQPFFAGFNDASGINSNPTPNSPYNVNNGAVVGQGAGEPGWLSLWQGSPEATVVPTNQAEGDGALFLTGGTRQVFRTLQSPLTVGLSTVEASIMMPFSAGFGGFIMYVNQNSIVDANLRVATQIVATPGGQWQVLDGTENGVGVLENTGFNWSPGSYQRIRIDINTVTRTWDFYVNGVRFNAPDPLGFRGQPTFLDEINFLATTGSPNGTYVDALYVGAVPEPSSLALAGLASAAGLARWRRKRKLAS